MLSLAVLLAQMCVAEIDIGVRPERAEQRECVLHYATLAQRARGKWEELAGIVRGYSTVFRCEGHRCDRPRLRMIRSMDQFGSEPVFWDERAGSWQRYREAWLRRVGVALQWLEGGMRWPRGTSVGCQAATQFGGRCAAYGACDAVPSCWRLAPCGDTASAFWVERICSSTGTIDALTASARR